MTTATATPSNTARQTLAAFLSTQKTGSSVEKILAAFTDPDAALTAKEIQTATGLSRTTVNDGLNKLAQNGGVIRMDKDRVTTWSLTPTRKAALKRAAKKAATAAAKITVTKAKGTAVLTGPRSNKAASSTKGKTVTDSAETTENAETPVRRRKGEIDFEIRAYFEANGNAPQGSYRVAKEIGSSAGAAYVALGRMTREGKATLVSREPDRYAMNLDSAAWQTATQE